MRDTLTIFIGGEAGQGLATAGNFLTQILTSAGYSFLSFQGYHSRIRGGHNTFAIKISTDNISGPDDGADLVLSINEETDAIDAPRLRPQGLLLAMSQNPTVPQGVKFITVPYEELAESRQRNLVALGVLLATLGLPCKKATALIQSKFKDNSEALLQALEKAYNWAKPQVGDQYHLPAKINTPQKPRLLINGNTALALGAVAGGINFCSFYPMTPGTSVALNMADWAAEVGLIVEQAEDEISAINMAIGASYAGAPSIVSTSGGGFSLMCEGVSLAGMLETPVVIVVVQRPGPATGLPTRTEQADLNLVLYAGHGEFPRAILTPGTTEECFQLAARAAWLAEESQGPVFILSDQFQADRETPTAPFDLQNLRPAVNPAEIHKHNEKSLSPKTPYERYSLNSDDGRSPRLLPGVSPTHLVKADSDEHTPDGHITEDLLVRVQQQDKRMKKMDWLKANLLPPDYHGDPDPETILVSWGSTLGASLDALKHFTQEQNQSKKHSTGLLHFTQVYPLNPAQWLPRLKSAKRVVFIESNYEGQFAHLVQRETNFKATDLVLRYDGQPLTAEYILKHLEANHG